jgi:hypothetical protein
MSQYPQYPYYTGGQYQVDPSGSQTGGYYPQATGSWTQGWLAVTDPGYVKGLLLGAALTYLMTNPKVQRAVVKGVVTLWSTVQGGVEEVKEQIQDIKAEMSMKADADKT